jgi:hypothetical protein
MVPAGVAVDGSVQVWTISQAGGESSAPLQLNVTRLSGTGDLDGDGYTDGDESLAGTDLTNPN